jgi:TPR repeat protein
MYEEGKGVKQDDFKALKFYQKACDLNSSRGCSSRLTSLPVTYLNPRSTHSAPVLHSFTTDPALAV